jgi:hypothetical protein
LEWRLRPTPGCSAIEEEEVDIELIDQCGVRLRCFCTRGLVNHTGSRGTKQSDYVLHFQNYYIGLMMTQ